MKYNEPAPSLDQLPDDVLGLVLSQLSLHRLLSLQQLNKRLHHRIASLGVPLYLAHHPQSHLTLFPPSDQWPPLDLLKRNVYINASLALRRWRALQVGQTWSGAVIPAMELTPDRLLLGVGGKVVVHPLRPPLHSSPNGFESDESAGATSTGATRGAKTVHRAYEHPIVGKHQGSSADIIGVASLGTSGTDEEDIIVAQYDGTLQQFALNASGTSLRPVVRYLPPQPVQPATDDTDGSRSSTPAPIPPFTSSSAAASATASGRSTPSVGTNGLHTMSVRGGMVLTTSSTTAALYRAASPTSPPLVLHTADPSLPDGIAKKHRNRAWSSLVDPRDAHLLLGMSDAVHIHPYTPDAILPSARRLVGPDPPAVSSAYDLTLPPAGSVHSRQLLLSAWYDSTLRLHDLRRPASTSVLEMCDPWTWADGSAMYACTYLAEWGVAGGGARHGAVALFDMRQPKGPFAHAAPDTCPGSRPTTYAGRPDVYAGDWSCFSPGGKNSPVYALKADSGRLYGVTERRAFVLAFDPAEPDDIVHPTARAKRRLGDAVDVPKGWKGRGGKWGWTVRYGEQADVDRSTGYEHAGRGVELFESL